MSVLLRRQLIVNNTGVGAPYVATEVYYDDKARKPIARQFDSQTNNPFELAKGAEVARYDVRSGLQHVVRYDGNGSVYTESLRQASTGIGTGLALKVMPTASNTTGGGRNDACFDLTGQYGVPPYQLEVTGQRGNATGYRQTATSQLEIYPVRFRNLASGEYFLKVTDATGDFRTQLLQVSEGSFDKPRGADISYKGSPILDVYIQWTFNGMFVNVLNVGKGTSKVEYQVPYGTLLDAYLLPGSNGQTWRQVYSDGKSNVYFVDASTAQQSSLALDNLILFNPDTTAEQNGGALVEVTGGMVPLAFTLTGPGGAKTNRTGYFDGLAGGNYSVQVRDSLGGSITVPFKLEDRYRLWRFLDYDDIDSTPMRVEFWRQDYQGVASTVCLTDEPVTIKSDGLSSQLGGQGDLPSVVGTSAEINILAEPDLFEPVVTGTDRNCRVDYYYNGKLHFRGYVKPDIFTQPLLDGLQPTNLLATDGLADLKDVDFRGHVGQRLGGRRPVLNTLLHCLSRCQISLPLRVFTNRRDIAMATTEAPELVTTTNRVGYYDEEKNQPADQRTVTDALAQVLGGTLVQREGTWQVRSALEAASDAPGRAYLPAGTPAGDIVAAAPNGQIQPPDRNRWHWLNANQAKQVRPGWKSLVGTTNAGWLENAFWQGEVFHDVEAWVEDFGRLRGTSGWVPLKSFPLVLQRIGEKGKDHSTLWPRSLGLSVRDDRALLSPALPLATGLEAVPAFLSFTGKLLASETYLDFDNTLLASPTTAQLAYLPYEVLIDGRSLGVKLAEFKLVTDGKDTTFEVKLDGLPSEASLATLRVYSWLAADTNLLRDAPLFNPYQTHPKGEVVYYDRGQGAGKQLFVARRDQGRFPFGGPLTNLLPPEEWAPIEPLDTATGQLLVTSVGVQLRPQNATWEAEDNFRAVGPGGTVRPTESLSVYHPDAPISAGLFAGNLDAFGKSVGNLDGTMTTSWGRAIDKDYSPLLEANTFDQLALRANNARLLPGTIRHRDIAPPYLLDSVDAPFDLPGRRFLVGSTTWHTKAAQVEVSLIEIGPSNAALVQWPVGARIVHRSYLHPSGVYLPYLRVARGGAVRVRH